MLEPWGFKKPLPLGKGSSRVFIIEENDCGLFCESVALAEKDENTKHKDRYIVQREYLM
jgi:hypothetical protein